MTTIIQKSFKAYQAANTPVGAPSEKRLPYARNKPLRCNAIAHDDFGTFDTTQLCYVAPYPQRMLFHTNHLWMPLPDGYAIAAHLMKNELGTAQGAPGGEFAGEDRTLYRKYAPMPESVSVTQIIELNTGDKVWSVPTLTLGAEGYLCGSVAGNGHITTNFFMGTELAVL